MEEFPPPHRYPASCASIVWQFPVGLQKGPCLVSYGDWVGFRSKGKHSLIKERRGESSSSAVQTVLERQNTWLVAFRDLDSGGGGRCQVLSCFALSRSQCQAQCLCTRPTAGAILNWGVTCSTSAHAPGAEVSVRPFCKELCRVWSAGHRSCVLGQLIWCVRYKASAYSTYRQVKLN